MPASLSFLERESCCILLVTVFCLKWYPAHGIWLYVFVIQGFQTERASCCASATDTVNSDPLPVWEAIVPKMGNGVIHWPSGLTAMHHPPSQTWLSHLRPSRVTSLPGGCHGNKVSAIGIWFSSYSGLPSPHPTCPLDMASLFWSQDFFFFFNRFIYFIYFYFWLHCVFVAVHRLSLVVASGGYSWLGCMGFSLQWLLLLWSMGSRHVGFSSCGSQAQ